MKRLSKMLLLISTSLTLTACDFFNFASTLVNKITLDETSITLDKGETKRLTASVKPVTASNKTIQWSSSEETVCTVSDKGLVTAVEYGISTVRASTVDGSNLYAECLVDVKEANAVLSSIEATEIVGTFQTGDTFVKSKIIAHYVSGSSRTVTDACTFTGYNLYQAGTSTVTVSYSEGGVTKTTTYEITVIESGVDSGKTKMNQSYSDYAKNNMDTRLDFTPSIGEPKLLVIPVWFTDSSAYITNNTKKELVRSDIEKAYFGSDADTGWNSVKSYYNYESHGLLNLTGTVSEWYDCGKSHSYYAYDENKTANLVNDSVEWYFTNHTSDSRRNYDTNHNGYLDGVMLIYAHPNYLNLNNAETNLWAYCYWVGSSSSSLRPNPNVFFWASYDFMYSDLKAFDRTGSYSGFGDTSNCDLDTHTFIHEMGHCFGLDDYYDYSDQYSPAGGGTMQDLNIGGHDPYSTMALGWTKPYIPTESVTLKIKPFQTSGDMILLTPSWNTFDSPFDEYLLLEYYTPEGLNEMDSRYKYRNRDRLPTTRGIRLWHVDARLAYRNYRGDYSITQVTSNANYSQRITHAFSNTYAKNGMNLDGYVSPIGEISIGGYTVDASEFNLLQYIRNNKTESNHTESSISNTNMFVKGSSFSMEEYYKQFICGSKLNQAKDLGWSFTVTNITTEEATITLTKAE